MIDRDPLAVRVLSALTAGVESAATVAQHVGAPEDSVGPLLERGVLDGLLTRLELDGTPAYQLTPKGLEVVGVAQGVEDAVDDRGHVDLGAAARMVMEQYAAAKDVATHDALRAQSAWPADDATRERVSAALNDAFARGAMTREQLDERTDRALTATTMGEVRTAGDGVIDLPPVLPTGMGSVSVAGGGSRLEVNPALREVRWRQVGYAAALALLGLFLLLVQVFVGLAVLLAGVAVGGVALRPVLRSGSSRVRTP